MNIYMIIYDICTICMYVCMYIYVCDYKYVCMYVYFFPISLAKQIAPKYPFSRLTQRLFTISWG